MIKNKIHSEINIKIKSSLSEKVINLENYVLIWTGIESKVITWASEDLTFNR